jgi:hypothetical protein
VSIERITNPFDNDSRFDEARSKWGIPSLVESFGSEYRYRCICGASWVGPIGDYCEWCHARWESGRKRERERLLFPEWLDWSDRYFELDPLDQRVWAQTRGFLGDFEAKWKRELWRASESSLVTVSEMRQALKRYERWTIHMRKSDNS